jgi:ABC-type multidrug transport system fused ATPase/permease subunit
MALPDGYATPIGEQGVALSSSQAKRIAIARVLLQDTPILLLDETVPEADPEDERQVQQALTRLIHGRTAFIIAQRLSTIVAADRVAVFRDGTIAELGTHEELLADHGYYASFVLSTLHGHDSTAAA